MEYFLLRNTTVSGCSVGTGESEVLDVLIANGTVVDGSGQPGYLGDVGLQGDRIAYIGRDEGVQAAKTVDATGKVVCPGIIDPHSHADLSIWRDDHDRLLEPLLKQGVTSFIGGNCGLALAPLKPEVSDSVQSYIGVFVPVDCRRDLHWRGFGEFLDTLERQGVLLNTAVLAPHGVIRLNEVGPDTRFATRDETAAMASSLDKALEEGAIGLSTGLQYFPGSQSNSEELMALAGVVKKHGGVFASHLRSYSSSTLYQAVDEVIEIARRNDVAAQISHIFCIPDLGVFGPLVRPVIRQLANLSKWWTLPLPLEGGIGKHLRQMTKAREQGVKVSMDVMPTTTGFTHLFAFFPPWAVTGTRNEVLARFSDPASRARMRHAIEHGRMKWPHVQGDSWSLNLFQLMGYECCRIMAVPSERNRRYEGMNLVDIARERGCHPLDAACDLLIEENGRVLVFESMAEPEDNFTERTMFGPLRHPEVAVSTDTILMGIGKPSHLFYGCYPKFLGRYVRDMRLLSLETAVRKITGLPAEHFGLKQRGRIEKGFFADVLVFDPARIAARGSFGDPDREPEGISHVFVNGQHAVEGGTMTSNLRSGRVLRSA